MAELIERQLLDMVEFLPRLLTGLVVFLGFWVLAVALRAVARRLQRRGETGMQGVLHLLGQTIYTAVLLVGVISALGTMGVNVSAMVASLGLAGFAVGFAVKDMLSNLLSGVMILVYRPFRPGDRISMGGFEGVVEAVDLRYTRLRTEQTTVLIPNANMFVNSVVLHSASGR